jgi:hypothetical protein
LAAFDGTSGTVMTQTNLSYYGGPTDTEYVQNGGNAAFNDVTVGGTAQFAGLNVSGLATVHDLTVTGSATIANLTVTGDTRIAGTTDTFATLTLDNAHFKSAQTTKPTVAIPASCGSAPSAAVTDNSTDSAGSVTLTTGSGAVSGSCATTVTFAKPYGAAPKSVQLTDSFGNDIGSYVGGITNTTFTVNLKGYGSAIPAGTPFTVYYWVVE